MRTPCRAHGIDQRNVHTLALFGQLGEHAKRLGVGNHEIVRLDAFRPGFECRCSL